MPHRVDRERDQFEAVKALACSEPITMLNLLRFRDKAAHQDGRDFTVRKLTTNTAGEALPSFIESVARLSGAEGRQ